MIFCREDSPILLSFFLVLLSCSTDVTLSPQKRGAGWRDTGCYVSFSFLVTGPRFQIIQFLLDSHFVKPRGLGQHTLWPRLAGLVTGPALGSSPRCPILRPGVWHYNCWSLSVKRKLIKNLSAEPKFLLQKRERVVKLSLLRRVKIPPVGGKFGPPPARSLLVNTPVCQVKRGLHR